MKKISCSPVLKASLTFTLSLALVNQPIVNSQEIQRPTDRWKADASGSYLGDLSTPVRIDNALPQLAEDGLKSGEAVFTETSDGLQLNIDQQSVRLLAYWESFDIGSQNSVVFN